MSKFNALLTKRFLSSKKEKLNDLAKRSIAGELSSFGGIFHIAPLSEIEQESLHKILEKYQTEKSDLACDLLLLTTLTSEVKSINAQAVILHGERIKKAQTLLKKYQDGAFTTWLIKTYGNRQTPYNFLQYYELHLALPQKLKEIIQEMPKQAIYSLSSRTIPQEAKEKFIEEFKGETKTELLEKLRQRFPLPKKDKRNVNKSKTVLWLLKKTAQATQSNLFNPSSVEIKEIANLLQEIRSSLMI